MGVAEALFLNTVIQSEFLMWLFRIDEVHTFLITVEKIKGKFRRIETCSFKYHTPCELYKNKN